MFAGIILILLFVLGGLWIAGSLFAQRRVLTWLASGVTLAWGVWLGAVAIARALAAHGQPKLWWYYAAAILLLAVGFLVRKNFRWPRWNLERDVWVVLALIPVLVSGAVVASFNGLQDDGTWVQHSFYNGDVTTFVSLVQKALLTPRWVTNNPFGIGLPLEYPTLLHAGMAEIIQLVGKGLEWIYSLPVISLLTALLTVPLFWLWMDVVTPEPAPSENWFGVRRRGWIYMAQALMVGYMLGMAWDTYVYPQSHFWLMGLFLLLISLLFASARHSGKLFAVQFSLAAMVATALLLANAVTGAVAVALIIVYAAGQAWSEKIKPVSRGGYLLVAIVFLFLFFFLSSGEAQFGWPHFSYGAIGDAMRFAPLLGLLIATVFLAQADPWLAFSVTLLTVFGLFTLFFAGRGIIVDNASRFFYHAGLVGFPLVLPLAIRLYLWARREVFYTTHEGLNRLMPLLLMTAGGIVILLPPLLSVAATSDFLLFQDEKEISPAIRGAAEWIADNTASTDVILTSPYPPWAIPFFTGRSLLRAAEDDDSAYWLSADDATLEQQVAAFGGDKALQGALVSQANYLLLSADDRGLWEPLPYAKVFDSGEAAIYKLK